MLKHSLLMLVSFIDVNINMQSSVHGVLPSMSLIMVKMPVVMMILLMMMMMMMMVDVCFRLCH